MELMRNEIMRAISSVLMNVGTEDGYEEVAEDFETTRFSGRAEQDERPRGNRVL